MYFLNKYATPVIFVIVYIFIGFFLKIKLPTKPLILKKTFHNLSKSLLSIFSIITLLVSITSSIDYLIYRNNINCKSRDVSFLKWMVTFNKGYFDNTCENYTQFSKLDKSIINLIWVIVYMNILQTLDMLKIYFRKFYRSGSISSSRSVIDIVSFFIYFITFVMIFFMYLYDGTYILGEQLQVHEYITHLLLYKHQFIKVLLLVLTSHLVISSIYWIFDRIIYLLNSNSKEQYDWISSMYYLLFLDVKHTRGNNSKLTYFITPKLNQICVSLLSMSMVYFAINLEVLYYNKL